MYAFPALGHCCYKPVSDELPPRITFCLPHELVIIADVIMDQVNFFFADAVEPRLSGLAIFTQNGRQQLLPWTQECISSAHALLFIIKWVDQGVVYSFNCPVYSVIQPASGTRCLDNRGSTEYIVTEI